jgi:hypothetical protein
LKSKTKTIFFPSRQGRVSTNVKSFVQTVPGALPTSFQGFTEPKHKHVSIAFAENKIIKNPTTKYNIFMHLENLMNVVNDLQQ